MVFVVVFALCWQYGEPVMVAIVMLLAICVSLPFEPHLYRGHLDIFAYAFPYLRIHCIRNVDDGYGLPFYLPSGSISRPTFFSYLPNIVSARKHMEDHSIPGPCHGLYSGHCIADAGGVDNGDSRHGLLARTHGCYDMVYNGSLARTIYLVTNPVETGKILWLAAATMFYLAVYWKHYGHGIRYRSLDLY